MGPDMSSEHIPIIDAHAHCDGPCGVYDPASARIAGEAVQSMTKKMLDLSSGD
ncbi:MAG: superoxide dismutase [Ni], partial [Candidatus Thermoplasmatota archaeon]|nr:superoxide dismutase [Ni] [Candidatus Thermoplasmatota archaeon]